MKLYSFIAMSAILLGTVISGPALGADTADNDSLTAEVHTTNNGSITYTSGGVSASGMQEMKALENAYNLKLLSAAKGGAYLAEVNVTITDSNDNNVLQTTTDGPVLLVKMPAGHYTVAAKDVRGYTATQKVNVSSNHLSSYVLRFPEKEE
jgi:hypothetical protein